MFHRYIFFVCVCQMQQSQCYSLMLTLQQLKKNLELSMHIWFFRYSASHSCLPSSLLRHVSQQVVPAAEDSRGKAEDHADRRQFWNRGRRGSWRLWLRLHFRTIQSCAQGEFRARREGQGHGRAKERRGRSAGIEMKNDRGDERNGRMKDERREGF